MDFRLALNNSCVENLINGVLKCVNSRNCWIIPLYLDYCLNPLIVLGKSYGSFGLERLKDGCWSRLSAAVIDPIVSSECDWPSSDNRFRFVLAKGSRKFCKAYWRWFVNVKALKSSSPKPSVDGWGISGKKIELAAQN